jgi:hypothetical protein
VSLAEQLVATLSARFDSAKVEQDSEGEISVRFTAAHPAVGDVIAAVEGDEVTVYIGDITHGHFNRFDDEPERGNVIAAEEVAAFLTELFADRVLLWTGRIGGGWQMLDEGERAYQKGQHTYVWSGPLEPKA